MIFGKYVNRYYLKYWYLFVLIFITDAIVDIAQLLIPMIIGNVVSIFNTPAVELQDTINKNPLRVFTGFTNKFTFAPTETLKFYETDLFLVISVVLIIGFIIFLGRMGWRFFSSQVGANVERDLRKEMFSHIQTMSLSYYSDKKFCGLLSFFTNDLQTIKQCFTDALIFNVDLIVLGGLAITLMSLLSWKITLITVSPLLLFIVLGGVIGAGETKRYKISSDRYEEMSDYTEENLQGFSVIKAFRKEQARTLSFRKYTEAVETSSVAYLKYSSFIDLAINLLLTVTFGLLFFFCGYSILKGGEASFSGKVKDIGQLTQFAGYYESLIWPMIAGGMLIDYVSRGNGARKRIATILDSTPDIQDETNEKTDTLEGAVEFKHLSFSYPDAETEILHDISFSVKPGMRVGIIGKTGSGKSTLVSLLPKLYNLKRGTLFIDGKDIMDWRKKDLRNHIGYVLQEAFLFSGTIRDNICFSEDELGKCDEEKMKEAAVFADIDSDIQEMKKGYDTLVGEKGTSLSGGQRQRVSIARAIYKDPSILILDDSLSAVDADTEKNILSHFQTGEKKKTMFIIAHRVSAIENSDLILVMDEGRIIAQGKHEELVKSCRLYQDICTLQKLEKEVS